VSPLGCCQSPTLDYGYGVPGGERSEDCSQCCLASTILRINQNDLSERKIPARVYRVELAHISKQLYPAYHRNLYLTWFPRISEEKYRNEIAVITA
jgi:hypothetical protein